MSNSENQQTNPPDDIVLAKQFLEGFHLAELQNLLVDLSTSPDQLLELIPANQIVMLAVHAVGDEWEPLSTDLPASVLDASRALHVLAHKLVPKIAEHPAVQHIFSEATADDDGDEDPSEIDWHRITSISPTFWWVGDLGSLVPWVRFGFRNARNELLLETTANFGDMAYLASAFALMLKTNMERAVEARKRGALLMEPVETATERINEMLQHASEISALLQELIPSEKKPDVPSESLQPSKSS